ncbi:unnamed protein product [Phytophthora lilii]|uniref:Unnamed protein product n=1 Tax=Phytophthora lilii TaxID=2077276 RepID=A0A9W6TBZ0_9STRA|nr:unnamed protein product [Phytophthora lilii]
MFCVRCDQYVVTEEEAKKQAEENAMADEERLNSEAEAAAEAERKQRIEQQFRLEEQAKQAREMLELEQARALRATSAHGPGMHLSRQTKLATADRRCLGNTCGCINMCAALSFLHLQKMGALTDSLSPNDHSERLLSISKAVREIAEAAQLLKQ